MKKVILGLAAAAAMAFAAPASAIDTPIGTVTADESGVVADGYSTNPGAAAGFVQVKSSGQVCADDNGSPDDGNLETGDPETGADSTSPTCAP